MKTPGQKSIVLVTVDCLRADHTGFMGYDRPTTPFLDSLSKESFIFPAAIVAGTPTYYSLPAILASRYPLALGRDVLGLGPDEPTLASVLKQNGYATASFSAANPYLSSRFGYEHGFDTFTNFEDEMWPMQNESANAIAGDSWASRLNLKLQEISPALGPIGAVYRDLYFEYCQRVTKVPDSVQALRPFPTADVVVDRACTWLSSVGDRPFFLWLHLMDAHTPYYPTEAALALMGNEPVRPYRARYLNCYWNRSDLGPRRLLRKRNDVVALYDAAIRWADMQAARLAEKLRSLSLWNNCIFALTADHGEEFLEHGGRYHPPSRLMEELIRVPLLLRVPGSQKREVAKSPFSMLHLAPTLLDAASLQAPAAFQGRSYWEQVREGKSFEGFAISECVAGCTNPYRAKNRSGPRVLSVRESRYKLVLHFDPAAENLYDLEADPGEQSPLAPAAQTPVRRRLLEIAREHLRQSIEKRDQQTRVQARLRELQLEWKDPNNKASAVAS